MAAKGVSKPVSRIVKAQPVMEGAGVRVHRTIAHHALDYVDPFLLLDEFKSEDPKDYIAGFPWHPHRGIETVTYMINGRVEHGDSVGNSGVIGPGDMQWMTAGRGIIHQEMPKQDNGLLWGLQLWVNLPAKDKMCPPRYQEVAARDIPEATLENGTCNRCGRGSPLPGRPPSGGRGIHPSYWGGLFSLLLLSRW
jgi:redox-sensitive bicupin YhaK (pirin superfamily)